MPSLAAPPVRDFVRQALGRATGGLEVALVRNDYLHLHDVAIKFADAACWLPKPVRGAKFRDGFEVVEINWNATACSIITQNRRSLFNYVVLAADDTSLGELSRL